MDTNQNNIIANLQAMDDSTKAKEGEVLAALPLDLEMKLAELEQALLTGDPMMPQYLQYIHRNLLQTPEAVWILTDEQRAIIVRGLSQQTAVVITTAKDAQRAKKPMKSMTLTDLGL